jgi:hypothetical protein
VARLLDHYNLEAVLAEKSKPNCHHVLQDACKISHDVAKSLAEVQYEKYSEQRRIDSAALISDFMH